VHSPAAAGKNNQCGLQLPVDTATAGCRGICRYHQHASRRNTPPELLLNCDNVPWATY
jgi:hypothetical protein